MPKGHIGLLHYSSPPVVGGVESVILAHAKVMLQEGYSVTVLSGRGSAKALPPGARFVRLPLLDSRNKEISRINKDLEGGIINKSFRDALDRTKSQLVEKCAGLDTLMVHNIFTKHFNLPLTAALHELLDEGVLTDCVAWCHDFSWSSEHSRQSLHPGYPWDLMKTYRPDLKYVVVSRKRQRTLSEILEIPLDQIKVVYNGIDPKDLLGVSSATNDLLKRLELESADLIILMPVRVTQAKNIEFAMRVTAELCVRGILTRTILTGPPDPHDPENLAYFKELKQLRSKLGIEDNFRFIFDQSLTPGEGLFLSMDTVNELYRVCDLVLMPSHREGFGMPVLEAGLAGRPVFATNIPSVEEIGGANVQAIRLEDGPEEAAKQMLAWITRDPVHQLRVTTRQKYTWLNIFRDEIQPLLGGEH